jgi:hypothetical protein
MQRWQVTTRRTTGSLGLLFGALTLVAPLTAETTWNGHTEQGRLTLSPFLSPQIMEQFVPDLLAAGLGPIRTVAAPEGCDFDPYIYVVCEDENHIVALDVHGNLIPIADLERAVPGGSPGSPAFDVLGHYGGALMVNDAVDGSTCAVMPDGRIDVFMIQLVPNAVACDPSGAFGGLMFVVDSMGDLYSIMPEGDVHLVAPDVGPRASINFATQAPFGPAMYLADPDGNRILRIDPLHEWGQSAQEWSAASTDRPGIASPTSIAISDGGAFGVGVMYVFDAASGSINMLDADGESIGRFARGLPPRVTIELPTVGAFQDSMVMTIDDEIWILQPKWTTLDIAHFLESWGECNVELNESCIFDTDHDGDIDAEDLLQMLGRLGE